MDGYRYAARSVLGSLFSFNLRLAIILAVSAGTGPAGAQAWVPGTTTAVAPNWMGMRGDCHASSAGIGPSRRGGIGWSTGTRGSATSLPLIDPEAAADAGAITGSVTSAGTGTPLPGVYVSAHNSSGSQVGASSTTNASGVYTISGLATGSYYVRTSNNSGYADEVYNDMPCPSNFCSVTTGTAVSVTNGATTSGISFLLTLGGVITGTVRAAASGAPLSGILVEAYNSTGKDVAYASTNASGAYSITRLSTGNSGLPTGTYYLRASGGQFVVTEVYSNLLCPNYGCAVTSGTGVSVTAGTTTSGIDFALESGGAINGTVGDVRTGAPLAGVGVWVYDASGKYAGYSLTNASGLYTASGLPTGLSFVRTSNKAAYIDELYDNRPCPGGSCLPYTSGTGVTVTAGVTTTGINFDLRGMSAFDFTGDLKSDILWRHSTQGDVWLWPMNGAAKTSESYVRTVGESGWEIRGLGDQTGDGQADVLWRHTTGMLYLWTMNGRAIVAETYLGTVDPAYDIVGTGDYDGDGKSDILWRHLTRGELWIWLMNGTAVANVSYVTTVDPMYAVMGSADLNGDTKADIVWRHKSAGDVWVWLMNGVTPASMTYVAAVGDLGYRIVGVADHTGDGKADILWWHSTRGEVWLWPMEGTARVAETLVGRVPDTGYRIVGNGDYNADSKADIVWHHATRGEVWIWLMNGATPLAQTYVASVPDVGYRIVEAR